MNNQDWNPDKEPYLTDEEIRSAIRGLNDIQSPVERKLVATIYQIERLADYRGCILDAAERHISRLGGQQPTVYPKCKTHPDYKAIKKPSCDCAACWAVWIARHGVEATESKSGRIVKKAGPAEKKGRPTHRAKAR